MRSMPRLASSLATLGLACASLLTAACDDIQSEDEELGFRDGDLTPKQTDARGGSPGGGGLWVNNGLSAPLVGGIDPAYPLSSAQGMSETQGVLMTANTRISAEYLVECALPLGSVIEKLVDGETIELEGQIGLAPEWEDGDCDEDCQQWVSACMLARTNVSAETIRLSLRATHPQIGLAPVQHFTKYEGSFFGNIFADSSAQFMCAGSNDGSVLAHLIGRTCSDDPAACGFELYEDCDQASRCSTVGYSNETLLSSCVPDGDTDPYHVINVYLSPSDAS